MTLLFWSNNKGVKQYLCHFCFVFVYDVSLAVAKYTCRNELGLYFWSVSGYWVCRMELSVIQAM